MATNTPQLRVASIKPVNVTKACRHCWQALAEFCMNREQDWQLILATGIGADANAREVGVC